MNIALLLLYPLLWIAHKFGCFVKETTFHARHLFGVGKYSVVKNLDMTENLDRIAIVSIFYRFHSSNNILIQELKNQSYKVIVVFNRNVDEEEIRIYNAVADAIICRENFGYDIGAYRDGILYLGKSLNDHVDLVLANDSVFYWSKSSGPVVDVLKSTEEFGGLTSNRNRHHLQAYFLVFARNTGATELVARYLKGLTIRSSKNWAIRRGEIGISRLMLKNGFLPTVYSHPMNFAQGRELTLLECESRRLRRMFNNEKLTDLEVVGQAFEKHSVHHLLGLSLGIVHGIPFKLDLTEIYYATEIIAEVTAAGLSEELADLTTWYSGRVKRGVGEHGLSRLFAKVNLR